MFWNTYSGVIGWIFAVGTVAGGLGLFTAFAWFYTPEPGEISPALMMAVYGLLAGFITALTASLSYALCLGGWIRSPKRSIASRGWIGAGGAGLGVLALSGLGGVWGLLIGLAPALLAMLVAGPLTARAARRADLNTMAAMSGASSKDLT